MSLNRLLLTILFTASCRIITRQARYKPFELGFGAGCVSTFFININRQMCFRDFAMDAHTKRCVVHCEINGMEKLPSTPSHSILYHDQLHEHSELGTKCSGAIGNVNAN